MIKKQVKNSFLCVLLVLLLFVLMLVSGWSILPAFADTEQYTGVLDDLQADSAFNKSDFDNAQLHPNTELIQIAENTDRQLFIYVHIVGDDLGFEKIVLNTGTNFSEIDFRSYELDLVSSNEGFYKYLVLDYKAPQDSYYRLGISRLEYPVDKSVDGTQQITYEYYPIKQVWAVKKDSGKIEYSYEYMQTIAITDKYVGSHNDGVEDYLLNTQYSSWTDTFYIAFSTDLFIENLIEAQIEYTMNVSVGNGTIIDYGTKVYNTVIRSGDISYFENDTTYTLWGVAWKNGTDKRKFNSILKPDDFKKNTGITVPKRKDGSTFDWVVTFYNHTTHFDWPGSKVASWVVPGDATILRLMFETDGVCYNLGVLDNRTSYIPPKLTFGGSMSFWQYVWNCIVKLFSGTANFVETVVALAAIFVVVALLPILLFVLSLVSPAFKEVMKTILKYIGKGIKWFFIGLWWLISAPFKLIIMLISSKGQRGT